MACSKDFYLNEDENAQAGFDFKLVEEDKALECPLCLSLLRQTMGTPCSHLFCLVCLQKFTGRRDIRGTTFRCPVCNGIVDTNLVFPNVYMDRCVRGSNVYCQQKKEGCLWKGTVAEYFNKHENECNYKSIECKNEGCKVSVMRKTMKDHEQHCPFRIVHCDYCLFEVRKNELKNHSQFCEKYPMICQENGCNAVIPKNEMGDHLQTCDFVTVNCPYMNFGCTEKVVRKNIDKHLELNTQRHMIFICDKYHTMENSLRTEIKDQDTEIERQSAKIENQNTKIELQNAKIEKQEKEIEQLKHKISQLETKPKIAPTKNKDDIKELLVKGADKFIRKKRIDFDENDYAVWFKKVFDLMVENKLNRFDNVMFIKIKKTKRKGILCGGYQTIRKYKKEEVREKMSFTKMMMMGCW